MCGSIYLLVLNVQETRRNPGDMCIAYSEIGLVAQLVRAPPCHGGGRGFEPHPGRCYHFPDDNLLETAYNYIWGLSSAGRASALQAEGHRFEPYRSHFLPQVDVVTKCRCGSIGRAADL